MGVCAHIVDMNEQQVPHVRGTYGVQSHSVIFRTNKATIKNACVCGPPAMLPTCAAVVAGYDNGKKTDAIDTSYEYGVHYRDLATQDTEHVRMHMRGAFLGLRRRN